MAASESPTYDREKVHLGAYRVEVWRAIIDFIEEQKPPAVVRRNAACSGRGVAEFFPSRGVSTTDAKGVCVACTALDQCREWAIPRCDRVRKPDRDRDDLLRTHSAR